MISKKFYLPVVFVLSLFASPVYGLYIDGSGHYSVMGKTGTAPGASDRAGSYQALAQSFSLLGEARLDDRSSFFLRLGLFDNASSYLGENPVPEECEKEDEGGSCAGEPQDPSQPSYSPYTPSITEAYARYASPYCVLEAGRRGRDWGLGMFLDSGRDPFEGSASVFEGVTCDINLQKSQSMHVVLGYDKLAERGSKKYNAGLEDSELGTNNTKDDLDQVYFVIEMDDTKGISTTGYGRQIGLYFANVTSDGDLERGGLDVDIKFVDLYLAFYFGGVSFRNEILLRNGKTSDPSWVRYGAAQAFPDPVRIDVNSIAWAGSFEYIMSQSGSALGPARFRKGNVEKHSVFLDYALAPGSAQGYLSYDDVAGLTKEDRVNQGVSTVAFHPNFKPGLIFFNGLQGTEGMRVDGAFDPNRVMNVNLVSIGYRYENTRAGDFEAKLLTGVLREGVPGAVKDELSKEEKTGDVRPVGFYGQDLGYELDLIYKRHFDSKSNFEVGMGYTLPGSAWQTYEGESPKSSVLVQAGYTFKF